MNNTIEAIRNTLLDPSNPAHALFTAPPSYEEATYSAEKIMRERTLAILAAQAHCPASATGYLANLQSPSLTEGVMLDSIRQLFRTLGRPQWDAIYRAFVDSRGYSNGDLERFLA